MRTSQGLVTHLYFGPDWTTCDECTDLGEWCLPWLFLRPKDENHSGDLRKMVGATATVSTFVTVDGQPYRPTFAGNGGLSLGFPCFPSRLSIRAVSSPTGIWHWSLFRNKVNWSLLQGAPTLSLSKNYMYLKLFALQQIKTFCRFQTKVWKSGRFSATPLKSESYNLRSPSMISRTKQVNEAKKLEEPL